MTVPTMNRHHLRVLQEIFSHPLPHNLEWNDVVGLIGHLGSASERHDGKYEFQIGAAQWVFTKPRDKDVSTDEILELRRFLTEAGVDATAAAPQVLPTVVLIDHQQARFFELAAAGSLAEAEDLQPKDPHGFRRHLEHRKEADYKGERVPEVDEYYERITERLKAASRILLIGDATAKSSAMTYLLAYLQETHKDVAARVVAAVDADLSSITLGEIERLAKEAEEKAGGP